MDPARYRELRAAGKLPHQQATIRTNATATEQREAMRAKRQEHQQQQDHARNVRQLAQNEIYRIKSQTMHSDESILAMNIARSAELKAQGNHDRARRYDALIAQQQAKVAAANAMKEFESSDEFITTIEVVNKVRPLVAQFLPDALVQHDAAIEVYKHTGDQDALFGSIAKLSNAATLCEQRARREQAAKLAEQQTLLSNISAEQAATSKANDEMIAASAKLNKAAE